MGRSGVKRIAGNTWRRIRQAVFQRDGWRCRQCRKRRRLQVDHIVPLSQGGAERMENYQTLCHWCHVTKTAGENALPGRAEWLARVRPYN